MANDPDDLVIDIPYATLPRKRSKERIVPLPHEGQKLSGPTKTEKKWPTPGQFGQTSVEIDQTLVKVG